MGKAILVIDEPTCCDDCPLMFENDCGVMQIHMQLEYGELYYPKPSWCPLKPMPKELEPGISEKYVDYCQGFNDCISEILGEEDVNKM